MTGERQRLGGKRLLCYKKSFFPLPRGFFAAHGSCLMPGNPSTALLPKFIDEKIQRIFFETCKCDKKGVLIKSPKFIYGDYLLPSAFLIMTNDQ